MAAITERSNVLTEDIDVASPVELVRLLRQGDAQLFSGFEGLDGICDESTLDTICLIAESAAKCIQNEGLILLSGCGTSGRLAHFISRSFNNILQQQGRPPCFKYFNAGGDSALFRSVEAPEDNWRAAVTELHTMLPESTLSPVLYIGITCGLSAPAVAAQLEVCINRPNTTSVLFGFNPPHLARKLQIEGWDRSFFDVVQEMLSRTGEGASCLLLTPAVGPEVITGSTRMKGGSATKMLLEIIFSMTLAHVSAQSPLTHRVCEQLLQQYEVAWCCMAWDLFFVCSFLFFVCLFVFFELLIDSLSSLTRRALCHIFN